MQGRLFTLLDIGFPSYFVLLLTGFIFATALGSIWAKRVGQDPDVVIDLGLAMLLAGVFGARILHVIADGYLMDYVHLCTDFSQVEWSVTRAECIRIQQPDPVSGWLGAEAGSMGAWDANAGVCRPTARNCLAWAEFWNGGLTYYGGFIGASAVALWLLRRDRFPFWKAADMAGIVVPLGLGFGRMGCLLAGCCFGVRTEGPWQVSFPSHSPASEWQFRHDILASPFEISKAVHPTQIYESAASFAISALLLLYLHGRKRYDGQVFVAFVGLYAAARFVLEFVRSDDRGGVLGLSTSQIIGLLLIVGAIFAHRHLLRRSIETAVPPRSPAEAST